MHPRISFMPLSRSGALRTPPLSLPPSPPPPTGTISLINNLAAQQVQSFFACRPSSRPLRLGIYSHHHAVCSFPYVGEIEVAWAHLKQLTPDNFAFGRPVFRHRECFPSDVQITTKRELTSHHTRRLLKSLDSLILFVSSRCISLWRGDIYYNLILCIILAKMAREW